MQRSMFKKENLGILQFTEHPENQLLICRVLHFAVRWSMSVKMFVKFLSQPGYRSLRTWKEKHWDFFKISEDVSSEKLLQF